MRNFLRLLFASFAAAICCGLVYAVGLAVVNALNQNGFESIGGLFLALLIFFPVTLPYLLVAGIFVFAVTWPAFLLLGTMLTILQRFWPVARHWLLWIASTVLIATILHPFIDSQYADPPPAMLETALGVISATTGSLVCRFIALGDPRSGWSETPCRSQLAFCLLVLATLGLSFGWRAQYVADHRYEVRTSSATHRAPTGDMTPTTVTLHEYVEPAKANGAHYLTTGKSLTFRFPKAYLLSDGGPQRSLSLTLRSSDFAPLGPYAYERQLAPSPRSRQLGAYIRNADIDLSISSLPDAGWNTNGERVRRRLGKDAIQFWDDTQIVGSKCGMTFATQIGRPAPDEDDDPIVLRRHFYLAKRGLDAAILGPIPDTATMGASCNGRLDNCVIGFRFKGFGGRYRIRKQDFCRWPSESGRIFVFLQEHLVESTERR